MFSSTISGRSGGAAALRVIAAMVVLIACAAGVHRLGERSQSALELRGRAMGTTFSAKVAGASGDRGKIESLIDAELQVVNELMSTYDPESEVSRFNRWSSTDRFTVSAPTIEVLALAREISEMTGGAFDVTVGPMVDAWGFGAAGPVAAPPSARRLAELRHRVGYRKLRVDRGSASISKTASELAVDLSAIAKGYAVDRVVDALVKGGYPDVLFELGGDLRAVGRRADGRPWRIAIERPVFRRGTVQREVTLSELALATSGDYRNYYEREGRRVSHVIDPRTGTAISSDVASVSVLHPSAAVADALATALSVMGVSEGLRLAEERRLAVLFLLRRDDGFEEVASSTFDNAAAAGLARSWP